MEHFTLTKTQDYWEKMARNFGIGTRDMESAGRQFAARAYAGRAYSSIKTQGERFKLFVDFIKERGLNKLEKVTAEVVRDYARDMLDRDLSPATMQNNLSAVNVILEEARGDNLCRVTAREVDLPSRTGVAREFKGNEEIDHASTKAQAIYGLAQTLGLRFEEASKLDLIRAEREMERDFLHVEYGTKGGQSRDVPLTDQAREAISRAREIAREQNTRNLIERDKTYRDHQRDLYREGIRFHAGRHEYANQRYSELMHQRGIETQSPVLSDKPADQAWSAYLAEKSGLTQREAREIDREARFELSRELGHHREDVVSAYIGGQN